MINKAEGTPVLTFDLDASPIEELVPGLTFQWLFGGMAVSFVAKHSSRSLVDAWAAKVVEATQAWPKERPFFLMNDFSAPDCANTPYNQQKVREMLRNNNGLRTVSVLVMQRNFTAQLSRLFLRTVPLGKMKAEIVFSREDALIWLRKQIDQYKAESQRKSGQ